jgi:hypothetical protein
MYSPDTDIPDKPGRDGVKMKPLRLKEKMRIR